MSTEKNPQEICIECHEKTRIGYQYNDGFFGPKLRSINHLEVGRSKIISSPITITLEFLYLVYEKVRDFFVRIWHSLFPRRPKIWGEHKNTRIVGTLRYAHRNELDVPIHHLKIEFWARTWWLQWRKLSEAYSDYDGNFVLPFDLRTARSWKIKKVQAEVYQFTHTYYDGGLLKQHEERFKVLPIRKKDLIGMSYNLRTVRLFLWEYRIDTRVPRVVIKDHDKDAPQKYSQGRKDALIAQILPIELTKIKHLEQIKLAPETISLQDIQNDYPESLTVCIEKKLPGYTRSDEWFGLRMMNGMNRGFFEPDPTEPGMYWIKYFGVCNYPHNNEYALPTAEIKFRMKENGLPTPVEIHLTGPLNAIDKNPWQKQVFTPQSGEKWLFVKRIARVNGGFSTEVDEHFCGTHLNTEQYAIAAYRNLRLNPLSELLLPHLKEVVLINHSADKMLLQEYIPSATALTYEGLQLRNKDVMGVLDWNGWKPMRVLSEAHTLARAENLFWNVVTEYVDWFFAENEDGIKKYWKEIFRMSEDLVNNAVPVFLSDVNLDSLSPEEKHLAQNRFTYYCGQYGFEINKARQIRNGELKAVSPLTLSEEYNEADWNGLKQACSYMIMMATFMHTWINEHQYDDMGEVLYNCGGLRFSEKPEGVLQPESELSIAPDLTRSTQMLFFTNFLSRTEYGFITRNEEHDINPEFKKRLEVHRKAFSDLGVNIDNIESRTNI